jgi:hypothetical protein
VRFAYRFEHEENAADAAAAASVPGLMEGGAHIVNVWSHFDTYWGPILSVIDLEHGPWCWYGQVSTPIRVVGVSCERRQRQTVRGLEGTEVYNSRLGHIMCCSEGGPGRFACQHPKTEADRRLESYLDEPVETPS